MPPRPTIKPPLSCTTHPAPTNVHPPPFLPLPAQAVKWARAHDADARRIAEEARAFALKHLTRPARLCYLFRLLTELSKQFKWVTPVDPGVDGRAWFELLHVGTAHSALRQDLVLMAGGPRGGWACRA